MLRRESDRATAPPTGDRDLKAWGETWPSGVGCRVTYLPACGSGTGGGLGLAKSIDGYGSCCPVHGTSGGTALTSYSTRDRRPCSLAGCGRSAGDIVAVLGCGSSTEGDPDAHARNGDFQGQPRVELGVRLDISAVQLSVHLGCPDTRLQGSARGCCLEGVEIHQGEGDTPGSEDLEMIRGRVGQMTDEDWQNRQVALRRGGGDPRGKARFKRGSVHTRLYRGACIFHNRIDHAGGTGCALHVAALRRGENPMDWKPQIW